jgi:hypothetical protein
MAHSYGMLVLDSALIQISKSFNFYGPQISNLRKMLAHMMLDVNEILYINLPSM